MPEPLFGDYLTKYAAQGYILSEISVSRQTNAAQVADWMKERSTEDQEKLDEQQVVYSGVWDKNIEDQMWSCHFGKSLDQMMYINKSLQQSEEGIYLASRISKVICNGQLYITCIWKVALETTEYEDAEAEEAAHKAKANAMTTF